MDWLPQDFGYRISYLRFEFMFSKDFHLPRVTWKIFQRKEMVKFGLELLGCRLSQTFK